MLTSLSQFEPPNWLQKYYMTFRHNLVMDDN